MVTFVCDSGAKYTDRLYNDFWMIDQGFIERESYGDLRDLIARRHTERQDYTVLPTAPLLQVFKTMRLNDVSQMVVLDENDHIRGIIDESDLLLAVTQDSANFKRPVSDFMISRLETVAPTASIVDLIPIFRADHVAIVADENKYYGLITKIDMINYLRKQIP